MKNSQNSIFKIRKTIILVGIILSISFCTNPKKESGNNTTNANFVDIEKQLDSVSLKMDTLWKKMIDSDNKKLANIRIIIDEYRLYLPQGADSLAVDTLYKSLDALPALRPNRENMAEPDVIDKYDLETNIVLEKIKKTREKYAELQKYQRIQLFMNDVQAADDSIIFLRRDYDEQVDVFNRIIERNQNQLKSHSEKYKNQKILPIFRLIP